MGQGGHGFHGGWHGGGWGHGWGGGWGWGPRWGWGGWWGPGPLVAGAVVGAGAAGAYYASAPRTTVVTMADPNYRMVECRRPVGAPVGAQLRIEVDGRPYNVVVPDGVPENGVFHVRIPIGAPQAAPQVATATPATTTSTSSPSNPFSAPPEYSSDDLPQGWEQKTTTDGRPYYVDHINKTTHWDRPISATVA